MPVMFIIYNDIVFTITGRSNSPVADKNGSGNFFGIKWMLNADEPAFFFIGSADCINIPPCINYSFLNTVRTENIYCSVNCIPLRNSTQFYLLSPIVFAASTTSQTCGSTFRLLIPPYLLTCDISLSSLNVLINLSTVRNSSKACSMI